MDCAFRYVWPTNVNNNIPDRPKSCSECIYRRSDGHILRCRRHAPSPRNEEHEPTYWPVVSQDDRCGLGSLGNNPKAQHVECETCIFWQYPDGGIKPRFPGGLSDDWWKGSGLCRARAPAPGTDENEDPAYWPVTHFLHGGCGDGVTIEDADHDDEAA